MFLIFFYIHYIDEMAVYIDETGSCKRPWPDLHDGREDLGDPDHHVDHGRLSWQALIIKRDVRKK
jgi:hypothetical protein